MPETNRHIKPVRHEIVTDTRDEVIQPDGKFVDNFKVRRDAQAQAKREAEAARSQQHQTSD